MHHDVKIKKKDIGLKQNQGIITWSLLILLLHVLIVLIYFLQKKKYEKIKNFEQSNYDKIIIIIK